ncbi:MAG: GAF domain-containing protein [Acidobacteria bacterium]|nr:GAF domain-containing protein [Acidobacteriota bacterium]
MPNTRTGKGGGERHRRPGRRPRRGHELRLARAEAIAHMGSWELDLVHGTLSWSDEAYRIFGAEPGEFAPSYGAFVERVFPEDREAAREAYARSLRPGGGGYEIAYRVLRPKTGEIRWVLEKCQHTRSATGRVTRSVGMVLDITARKLADEALERSMRRFELLAGTAEQLLRSAELQPAVESICRRVMEYLSCQVALCFLADERSGRLRLAVALGVSRGERERIEWLDYGQGISGVAARDGRRVVAENIPAEPEGELALLCGAGLRAYACHPLEAADGRVLGTLSFGTRDKAAFPPDDVSLMKAIGGQVAAALIRMQGELSLRHTAEELARSNRDLEQFAYVSSHDLREPLRTVTGFVQILEDRYRDQLDARAHEYIGFAVDGARRMQQLIDDLLAYARVGSALSIQPGNARDSLDRALDALKGMIGESGAVITTDSMPVVHADATLLCQVFQNLVENAIKFRSADPLRIHVGARRERGGWLFRVTDNGIGMEREHGERIFVIFKRLHSREKYPGTGIGLALCKKIVERHGGRIWVESEPGRGSTFYFTLPDRTE